MSYGYDKGTYCCRHLELEQHDADQEADDNADARRKVLDNIIRIPNYNARQHATSSLEHNGTPHNPIVALEKAVLADSFTILPNDATEAGSKDGVKA